MIQEKSKIKTAEQLQEIGGIFVHQKYFDSRKPNTDGKVLSLVPGYGGDVWYVKHDDQSIAVYSISEMIEIQKKAETMTFKEIFNLVEMDSQVMAEIFGFGNVGARKKSKTSTVVYDKVTGSKKLSNSNRAIIRLITFIYNNGLFQKFIEEI